MTTTQPAALPELPEPDRTMWQHGNQIDHYTADQMRARDAMWAERLAALQPQPAAAVSDEETQADRLEAALESLVNLCNNDLVLCNSPEVIAAEATLERLYRARTTPKDATVTAQPSIPEACQFEPQTAPEAFLQQEMAKLRPQAVPIGRDDLKVLMSAAGYVHATAQEKADFINGSRNAEAHHGITAQGAQGEQA